MNLTRWWRLNLRRKIQFVSRDWVFFRGATSPPGFIGRTIELTVPTGLAIKIRVQPFLVSQSRLSSAPAAILHLPAPNSL
jgi:hypothetical protein